MIWLELFLLNTLFFRKSPLSLCPLNERLIVYFVLLSLLFTVYYKSRTVLFQQNQLFQSSKVPVCTSCDRESEFRPLNVANSPSRIYVLTGRNFHSPVSPRNIQTRTVNHSWALNLPFWILNIIGMLCVSPIAGNSFWKSFWTRIISKTSFLCVMNM